MSQPPDTSRPEEAERSDGGDAARSAEHARLAQSPGDLDPWRLWGPYVSARQWGTVREDYSADGDAWAYLPFDQAHARAYRWGEDGMAAICDRFGFLNVGIALWNGHDDRLKERFFGLTNAQGNHGEDVKEYWWPLDATPTHSYADWLYRYPQAAYPYADLLAENARRTRTDDEYELSDTGVLADDRFFDLRVTHAKASPTDVCLRISATNHGPDAAPLDLVPQVWFRNTWSWGRDDRRPTLSRAPGEAAAVDVHHQWLGRYQVVADGHPRMLFCDNETDDVEAFGTTSSRAAFPTNAINRAIVHGDDSGVNPDRTGTKMAYWFHFDAVAPGETVTVQLRLRGLEPSTKAPDLTTCAPMPDSVDPGSEAFGDGFDSVLSQRLHEADEFYSAVIPDDTSDVDRHIARSAFAGLLWGKQLYRYSVPQWLAGDPAQPTPPPQRQAPQPAGRNTSWTNLDVADVISMPDEWEYPWFATWDLAFHAVTLAHVDPAFAKSQLVLMCREWVMSPNGQLPAYEWAFSDVNPPVHAWATWQVYVIDGRRDRSFLIQVFTKLLMNFSWWVNRKDPDGSNLFEGGFLGMDNIGLFDRSSGLGDHLRLEQSDATSWMAFSCLSMLRISLELSRSDSAWNGTSTTFLEHFLSIAEAMENFGSHNVSLWNEEDGFYYDVVVRPDGTYEQLRVRSMVGLLPLLAVGVSPSWVTFELPELVGEVEWLKARRPHLTDALFTEEGKDGRHITLSLLEPDRIGRVLGRLFDEGEFLSPHGIRSLSAAYRDGFSEEIEGRSMSIHYTPGESDTGLFGGNSNWRGPVWFPVNVLLVDALRTYSAGVGKGMTVELPTGSGKQLPLADVVSDLEERLVSLFRPGPDGRRPSDPRDHPSGPLWSGHPTFSEYFHGDTGIGLGASHQTGWTALVAHLVCDGKDMLPGRPRAF